MQQLIGYDTAPAGGSWRGKAVYVANNAYFASFAELSATEQPSPHDGPAWRDVRV